MLVLCYTFFFFFFFDWSPTRLAKSGWITSHYLINLTVNLKYCCDLNEVADQTLDSSMLPCVKTQFCNIWIQGIKYIVKKNSTFFNFEFYDFAKNSSWKNMQGPKTESTSSDDEQVLMFLSKQRKKLRFWVHPVIRRRQQQGEFRGSIQELKLYHGRFCTYFGMSAEHGAGFHDLPLV